MKRREFLCAVAAAGVGTVVARAEAEKAAPVAVDHKPLVATPLSLMAPRADGFEAVWAVNSLCRGRVEWEDDAGAKGMVGADGFGFVPQGTRVLRVRVSGLKPGHTYRVRAHTLSGLDDRTEVSPWKTFRTLNPAADSTKFVVWNDTHVHDDTIQKLHEVTPEADFLMWNGDTCNDWKSEDLLVPTLLHPGQRDISTGRPLLFTWGNHDSRGAYAFEAPGMMATPSERPFYAFRSGPVAFICLHTGEDKPDNHPSFKGRPAFDVLRAEQAAWLKAVIRHPDFANAPYRVIFCHIPLRWLNEAPQDYSKKGFDQHSGRSRAAWHDSLVEWKAQVIVSGHTHSSAWLPPTAEFPYGQLVGGGPRMEQATWIEGTADAKALQFRVHDLSGKLRKEVSFAPLA